MEVELRAETEKWLKRAKEERENIVAVDEKSQAMLKNVDAYLKDTEHFREKGDLIRAFEAVVWAWSWIEICKELDIFKEK